MKLLNLLANLLLLVSLASCATYRVSDWQVNITLPASQDCYGFNVVSGKEERLPAESEACKYKKAHSVWIDSENYKMLRSDIQRNCQISQCKQIMGAFDEMFLAIDEALKKIPGD